jgi:hypothetical protein
MNVYRTIVPWQGVLIIARLARWFREDSSWMEADYLHFLGRQFLSHFLEKERSCHFGGAVNGTVRVRMHVGLHRRNVEHDLGISQ